MRMTGVVVSAGAMGMAVHVTRAAVNMMMGLRRHRSYSTRVVLVNAVDGAE
jgi:hypothetical protein